MENIEEDSNLLEDTEVIPVKAKRIMSEKQKAALAIAREKAWAKRRELGEITRQEKELKIQEKEVQKQEKTAEMTRRKNTVFKKLKKDVVVSLESSDEDKQMVTDSQSEEEEEKEGEVQQISKYIEKRLKVTKARPMLTQEDTVQLLREKILNEGKRVAYQSLFPGHTCPF